MGILMKSKFTLFGVVVIISMSSYEGFASIELDVMNLEWPSLVCSQV